MNEILQTLAVALAVCWAAYSVWARYFPNARHQLQHWLALKFVAPGRPRIVRRLGLSLLAVQPTAAGCDSGCSRCDGCGVASPARSVAADKHVC